MQAAEHKKQVDQLMNRANHHRKQLNDEKLTVEHMVLAMAENQRFTEILQCAEGLSEDQVKQAIKKSRMIFNRCGKSMARHWPHMCTHSQSRSHTHTHTHTHARTHARTHRGTNNEELAPEPQTNLSKYARDLTALARENKLDPCIGRSDELRRVINILSRRTKNNPVILGDPGVGKTALVDGLAYR